MAAEVRRLDRRVKVVWEFPTIVTMAVFWLVASFAYALLAPENSIFGISHFMFPIALLVALLAFIGLPLNIWIGMVYRNFTFELSDKDIIIREGVITRKTTVIPYARIQDIRSERTLIERMLGIATLEIETAGSSKVASETLIPGIADKNELISEIMERVEKAKSGDGISSGGNGARQGGAEAALAEVLKELKTISSKLDTLGAQNSNPQPRKEKRDMFEPLEHDESFKKFRKK